MKYCLGIDAGSSYTKLVLIDPAGTVAARRIIPSREDINQTCLNCLDDILQDTGVHREDLEGIVATGYGRRQIRFADKVITEITALAAGAFREDIRIRTILDVGGQDSKAIALDKEGKVIDFALNSKCAAGTGRFLEVTSASLGLALEDLAPLSQKADKSLSLSSTCTVFAESEIISHLSAGEKKENIIKALHTVIVNKIIELLHQIGFDPGSKILFTGGVALDLAIVRELSGRLDCPITVPPYPQHIGAFGAAVYLKKLLENPEDSN